MPFDRMMLWPGRLASPSVKRPISGGDEIVDDAHDEEAVRMGVREQPIDRRHAAPDPAGELGKDRLNSPRRPSPRTIDVVASSVVRQTVGCQSRPLEWSRTIGVLVMSSRRRNALVRPSGTGATCSAIRTTGDHSSGGDRASSSRDSWGPRLSDRLSTIRMRWSKNQIYARRRRRQHQQEQRREGGEQHRRPPAGQEGSEREPVAQDRRDVLAEPHVVAVIDPVQRWVADQERYGLATVVDGCHRPGSPCGSRAGRRR